MCCVVDCKPDIQPGDWTPCIECMDADERARYMEATSDQRTAGVARDVGDALRSRIVDVKRRLFEGEIHQLTYSSDLYQHEVIELLEAVEWNVVMARWLVIHRQAQIISNKENNRDILDDLR